MNQTITLKFPGLPDDDGRVRWNRHEVDYVPGRNLSTYLAEDLLLDHAHVSHVVVGGRAIEPSTMVRVPVPESKWQKRWRKLRRAPVPTVEVSAFDAYTPRRGEEIAVVPLVEGKNASTILGVVGAIVAVAMAYPTGGASLAWWLTTGAQVAIVGYSLGSTVGALVTPKPKMLREHDDGPSSYMWDGTRNDDRAGVAKPILIGQRLVGGKRIGLARRRPSTVEIRTSAGSYSDSAPQSGSEQLELLILIAAHECEGPVGVTNPDAPINLETNKPDVRINGSHYSNYPGMQVEWRTGAPGQTPINGFDTIQNTYDLAIDLTTNYPDEGSGYTYTTADEVDAFEVLLNLPVGLSHSNEKGVQRNTTRYILEFKDHDAPDSPASWHNADYEGWRSLSAATRASRLETRRINKLPDGSDLPTAKYDIRLKWKDADFTNPDADTWLVVLTGITEEIQKPRNYEGESILAIRGLATDQLSGPIPQVTSVWRGLPVQEYEGGALQPADFGVGDFAPAARNPFWSALALMRNTKIGAGHAIADTDIDLGSFATAAAFASATEHVATTEADEFDEPRHQFDAYIDSDEEALDLVQRIISTARGVLIFSGNKWRVAVDAPGTVSQVFGMASLGTSGSEPDLEPTFAIQYKSERHQVNCYEATFDDIEADWENESHSEFIDNRDPVISSGTASSSSDTLTGLDSTDGFVVGQRVHVSSGFEGFPEITAKTSTTLTLDTDSTYSGPVEVKIGAQFITSDDPESAMVALGLPILRRKLQFWGVTRRSQVARELRHALRQVYALREFGSFTAGTKSILCEVYDLIGLSNDTPQWGYSGEVRDGCLVNLVMFDREVPFETGTPYEVKVHFRAPGEDGKDLIETRTVADAVAPPDGESYFGLTVTEPFSRVPEEGDEWFYGPVNQSVRPARIIDIDRDADDNRSITWAEYNDSIYDTDGPIRIPSYSLLPDVTAPPAPIPELKATQEDVKQNDGRWIVNILNQWTRPQATRTDGPYGGARLEYSFDDEHWTHLATVEGTEHRWTDAPQGVEIFFRVMPRSVAGRYNYNNPATDSLATANYGGQAPVVTVVTGRYHEGAYIVEWDSVGPEYEYEVRSENPADWTASDAGFLWRGKATSFIDDSPDARNLTYYVKARDPFGNYSSAANSASINDTAPAAPTIGTITRYEDGFKIRVTPPGGVTDIIAIHLHASQTLGFTPSAANRVSNPLPAAGGEFGFKTGVAGKWYFKATCEDWLSERMNDWVYSSAIDDEIIVIQPVDPTSVTCDAVTIDGAVLKPGRGGSEGYEPKTKRRVTVDWNHVETNPAGMLEGFRALIWDSADSYDEPIADSGLIPELGARTWRHNIDDDDKTIVAGVFAVYKYGITSDLITSTGLDIPLDTNPILRDSDDRQVGAYAESFDGTITSGFGFDDVTTSLVAPAGQLKLTRTGTDFRMYWNFISWANAYLEPASLRNGFANLLIRLKVDTPAQLTGPIYVGGDSGSALVPDIVLPIINDGEFHTYIVPFGTIDSSDTGAYVRLNMNSSGIPNGGSVHITAIALTFESMDLDWDGSVQRGIRARQQFDRDPDGDGDGLYGFSPLRIEDTVGNVTVVNKNGIFYFRDDAGNLVTETPGKLGREGYMRLFGHGALMNWDDSGIVGAITTDPAIPEPISYNKARMIIEDAGNHIVPSSIPAYPVRRWFEMLALDSDGFHIAAMFFYGGNAKSYKVSGPWTPTNESKSALTLNAGDSDITDATNDAWYYVANDGSIPGDANDKYYRIVVWIKIEMPEQKRSNGSRYYCDLTFSIRVGRAYQDTTFMQLDVPTYPPSLQQGFKTRVQTSGETFLIPIVCFGDVSNPKIYQNVKVDWTAQSVESGGSAPTSVQVDSIQWDYIENCTSIDTIVSSSGTVFAFNYIEAFS